MDHRLNDKWRRKISVLREKPITVLISPPGIPYGISGTEPMPPR